MKPADEFAPRPHYDVNDLFAFEAAGEARATFLRKTYSHLFLAILAFLGLTALFLQIDPLTEFMTRMVGGASWLIVLIAFFAVSWVAERWARSDTSIGVQYAGLALYTIAEALIFVPLICIARSFGDPDVVSTAGILTILIFTVLTAVVFITGKDFSFLKSMITVLCFVLMGAMVFSWMMTPISTVLFASLGVVLASGSVLYSTSNVLHHYHTNQYVAASLHLFASIALLFWYLIQLVMAGDD